MMDATPTEPKFEGLCIPAGLTKCSDFWFAQHPFILLAHDPLVESNDSISVPCCSHSGN